MIFIDAPGGTGKTYLYNTMIDAIENIFRTKEIAVAWTGIAATLLKNGRTIHSTFRLPLHITSKKIGGHAEETPQSKLIRDSPVIVWDEAPMSSRAAVEAVDSQLRSLMRLPNTPMGGKLVLLGGDFRQLLPVVRNACAGEVIDKCVQSSLLWSKVKLLHLTENMRAAVQKANSIDEAIHRAEFADWLVRLGNLKVPFVRMPETCVSAPTDLIEIPRSILVYSVEQLLEFVYKDPFGDWHVGRRKSILCPTNRSVDKVNKIILSQLPGEEKTYYSIDEYEQRADDKLHITEEFLNAINLPAMPPHELKLKVGAIVILVRNLDVPAGLCNGVRLRICSLGEYTIGVEKLYDPGEECDRDLNNFTLPRVLSKATEGTNLPGALKRLQFPIRPAFAMTINKSQGQTFDRVGVLLAGPCFSHGELYVALSRVGSFDNIRVFIADSTK